MQWFFGEWRPFAQLLFIDQPINIYMSYTRQVLSFFFYPRISFLLKNFFFPAPSVGNVQSAIETIYPLVKEFSKQRTKEELMEIKRFHMKRSIDGWESDRSNESEEDK